MDKNKIDKIIANSNTIGAIEGQFPFSKEEEKIARDYLEDKITKEEYERTFLEASDV